MNNATRYALLDTDFISKAHLAQKDDSNHLIDIVLDMPGYEFFCHEQIVAELSRHNVGNSPEWLAERIAVGKIHCYSDADIVYELSRIYFKGAVRNYLTMLEVACDAFERGSYISDYARMIDLPKNISNADFMEKLSACDQFIGQGNSLGEKKSFVLLQLLKLINPGNVYVFCSDDGNARKGAVALSDPENDDDQIYCISTESDNLRQIYIQIGLDGWSENPFTLVFGHGLDAFKNYNASVTGNKAYSHNNYVELLFNFGIIGFILYYSYYIRTAFKLFKSKNIEQKYRVLGLGVIFTLLVFEFGAVNYYSNIIMILVNLISIVPHMDFCYAKNDCSIISGNCQK